MNWDFRINRFLLYKQLGFKGDKIPRAHCVVIRDFKCPINRLGDTVTLDLTITPGKPKDVRGTECSRAAQNAVKWSQ